MMPMLQDPHRNALRLLSDRMVSKGFGDYLLSERFSRFCRKNDIYDIWSGLLTESGDRPDLYGSDMIRHAFFLLLQHIFRVRNAEFPRILAGILANYAEKPPDPSFLSDIKQDVTRLGYAANDLDDAFSALSG